MHDPEERDGLESAQLEPAATAGATGDLNALRERLQLVTAEWKAMPDEREALTFYRSQVFPLTKELFSATQGTKVTTPIYGLILSVGESVEPAILSISAVRPERVMFLYTTDTEARLDEIVKETGLAPSRFDKYLVDPNEPVSTYTAVRECWERWGRREDIAVDYTGGTKSMAAGAVLASVLIGARLVYVGHQRYLRERRRPEPGSEFLSLVSDPLVVSGALEERYAAQLFKRHDYSGAKTILESLAQRMPNPRPYEALANLAAGYQAWEELDARTAADRLRAAVVAAEIAAAADRTGPVSAVVAHAELLNRQARALEALAGRLGLLRKDCTLPLLQDAECTRTLIFSLYVAALHDEERSELDGAALLIYRILELVAQRRLATYGLDTANPDYSILGSRFSDADKALAAFNRMRASCVPKSTDLAQLPATLDLVNDYVLLELLADPCRLGANGIQWPHLRHCIQARNGGIYAHGFTFVTPKEYQPLKSMVNALLGALCAVEGIDMARAQAEVAFIDPWPDDR